MSEASVSSSFRGPVSAPAPAAEPATSTPDTTGTPTLPVDSSDFYTYEQEHEKPFMANYYELDNTWNKEPSMERDLREIEGYIREQVQGKKVANTTKAARDFVKELERKAELTRYESPNQRITKLIAYIDFRRTIDG